MIIRSVWLVIFILVTCIGSCHSSNNSNDLFFISSPSHSSSSSNGGSIKTAASVLEHHNDSRRDGTYMDPTLTKISASTFHIDPMFRAQVPGAIYAQLLYVAGEENGNGLIIAATEANNVAAFDAVTGTTVWIRNLGTPVSASQLPCGNIDPLGITGTPVIDPASDTLFLDAMTTPDNGITKKHLVFALSIKDGTILPGWPIDISAHAAFAGVVFDASVQNQRGALLFMNGIVYVPYGGHYGDCGDYHGWLIGVPIDHPAAVKAWATGTRGGGSWAPGGVASENGAVFISTGNTFDATAWSGGEAIIRFSPGPVFSGKSIDYFAPDNWQSLDAGDIDIGGSGPVIVDVPGATPSKLLVGLGKDGKMYLVDRENLGGVGNQIAVEQVATNEIINAAAAYSTTKGTYVVFKGNGTGCPKGQSGDLTAVRILPGSPPSIETAWCAHQNGEGSPMVTTTDGSTQAIVWSVGAEGDNRLQGFDGDTGQVVYAGGGPADVIGSVRRYHTPILANGRIYVAADGVVRAFVR